MANPVGRGHKLHIDRETLLELYCERGLSMAAIGETLGCSGGTVLARLREHGIPRRRPADYERRSPQKVAIDEALLHRLYVDEKRSSREIAAIVGCNRSTAALRVREAGLTRPRSDLRGWRQSPAANEKRRKAHMKIWDERGRRTPEHALHLQRAAWKQRAKECYERDTWTCRDCGVHCDSRPGPSKIQCHHVIPRANGGGDELENLVTLCNACHKTREWRAVGALFA